MIDDSQKKLSLLDVSEVAPIVVDKDSLDDFYLSDKWKGIQISNKKSANARFPFETIESGVGENNEDEDGEGGEDRPGIDDISILSQEVYYDNAGMARVKVTFKIYNSSEEPIDKFEFAIAPRV